MKQFNLSTGKEGFYDITSNVQNYITEKGVKSGICVVFSPHTTSAITINENADPDVITDLLLGYKDTHKEDNRFQHLEGNTTAHLKSSTIGCSETIIIDNGKLVLGIWQGVYFAEFDGPRNRRYFVKIISN